MRYKNNVLDKLVQLEALATKLQFQVNRNVDQDQTLESIEMLKEGNFRNAFINKEKTFKGDNEKVGIKVFQEKDIVLWGAARHAIEEGFVTKGKFAIMRANQ